MNAKTTLRQLGRHVYWSLPDEVRDRPIMGAVLGERATLIVEAGASPAHAGQFRTALQALGGPPARFVAVSHWHWDHVFGIAEWNLPTIAHRETRRQVAAMAALDWRDAALDARVAAGTENPFIAEHVKIELSEAERAGLKIVPPDVIIDDHLEIDLGGVACQLIHVGGDHTADSTVVYVPEDGAVFLGDCLYNASKDGVYYYTRAALYPMLDKLLALPADTYLLAHQAELMTRLEFEREARLLRTIGDVVADSGERQAAFDRLPNALDELLTEDHVFYVDAFLKGLQLQE